MKKLQPFGWRAKNRPNLREEILERGSYGWWRLTLAFVAKLDQTLMYVILFTTFDQVSVCGSTCGDLFACGRDGDWLSLSSSPLDHQLQIEYFGTPGNLYWGGPHKAAAAWWGRVLLNINIVLKDWWQHICKRSDKMNWSRSGWYCGWTPRGRWWSLWDSLVWERLISWRCINQRPSVSWAQHHLVWERSHQGGVIETNLIPHALTNKLITEIMGN